MKKINIFCLSLIMFAISYSVLAATTYNTRLNNNTNVDDLYVYYTLDGIDMGAIKVNYKYTYTDVPNSDSKEVVVYKVTDNNGKVLNRPYGKYCSGYSSSDSTSTLFFDQKGLDADVVCFPTVGKTAKSK